MNKSMLQQAKSGNKAAFTELYTETAKELGWYCRSLTGNPFDAEDLLQDTYLTAWDKLDTFHEGNFTAWLRTIALHKWLNHLRKEKRLSAEELPDDLEEAELLGPENLAEQKLFHEAMLQIMDKALSPSQRMTILLFYYDQKSVAEIAHEMDCSEGTVKSRLYHARKKLREELEQQGFMLSGGVPLIGTLMQKSAAQYGTPKPLHLFSGSASKAAAKVTSGALKTKLIAGAAAVAVAGGTGGIIYYRTTQTPPEPETSAITEETSVIERPTIAIPTDLPTEAKTFPATEAPSETKPYHPESGGELIEYEFQSRSYEETAFRMVIPERFWYKRMPPEELNLDSYVESRIAAHICDLDGGFLELFAPDDGSSDFILFEGNIGPGEFRQPEEVLQEELDSVTCSARTEITYPVDPEERAAADDLPESITAERFTFTGTIDGRDCTGFAIHWEYPAARRSSEITVIFCDESGIRTEEYAAAEASLVFTEVSVNWITPLRRTADWLKNIPSEWIPKSNP